MTSSLAEQLSLSTLGASVLERSLSLIVTISSGSSFQRRVAVGKNVILWPAVFKGEIATAAAWRDVDALVALCTTGGGGNMLLSSVDAYSWYFR